MRNTQRLVQVHNHRITFIDEPYGIFSREGRRRDNASFEGYCAQGGPADCAQGDIAIRVDLGLGRGEATVWTCDLTKAYVEINGDYRS